MEINWYLYENCSVLFSGAYIQLSGMVSASSSSNRKVLSSCEIIAVPGFKPGARQANCQKKDLSTLYWSRYISEFWIWKPAEKASNRLAIRNWRERPGIRRKIPA